MADNVSITAGSGTVIATDECTVNAVAVQVPRGKVGFGTDGSYVDVSATNPLPVTVANFPATQPVSGTVAVSNFPATQAVSASALPLPTGAATEATLAAHNALFGAVAETAPASDTASSGLNGRLQRVAQRITSLIGLLPSALTGSGNLKVAVVESTAAQAVTGTFWQATQPVSGTVTANAGAGTMAVNNAGTFAVQNTAALPAGTNVIGTAISPQQTGALYSGTTALTPKFAAISSSGSGDNTAVAAVASKKIRVLGYTLIAAGTVNVKFRSGATSDLTGAMALVANSGAACGFGPVGHFETVAGEALTINLSAAVAVAGHLVYVEV